MLQTVDDTIEDDDARAIGALYYTLINGLMMLWLVDPDTTPTSRQLTRALRAITAPPTQPG